MSSRKSEDFQIPDFASSLVIVLFSCGGYRIRTDDPLLAKQVL